jgi:hypothetical protein
MRKVRLFSDWADSKTLAEHVYGRSVSLNARRFAFGDVQFEWGNDYDYAVVFNFAVDQVRNDIPRARIIGLVLEPQEILDVMYQGWQGFDTHAAGAYYCFTPLEGYITALGVGLPQGSPFPEPPPWHDRKLACMIASSKTYTPHQVKRREVMARLLATDLEIDFYGRGMSGGSDERVKGEIKAGGKDPILDQYKYVIDFENSPWALTDKFFDPVLRGAVPITNSLAPNALGINDGHHWVKFDKSPVDIVKTVSWFLKPHMGREPSSKLQAEVQSGKLCLANWINEKVSELP